MERGDPVLPLPTGVAHPCRVWLCNDKWTQSKGLGRVSGKETDCGR